MEPILRFENVSKHYPNGVHALKGVSFEMAEGEFISVIGPSGSGKSTLLRAINRLIPISGGTVWLDGQAVSAQRGAALRQLRRKVGMIFQNYNLVPVLNVYENIVMPIQLDGKKPDQKFIKEIVALLGLEKKLYNMPNTLSGGQQQRVAIARALASKPAIILADEPTGNLDSKTSDEVIELLKVTSQKFHQTIVMITHNPEIAAQADRTIHIEDGRIAE